MSYDTVNHVDWDDFEDQCARCGATCGDASRWPYRCRTCRDEKI